MCTLLQAYIWEVFYLANIAIAKEVYIAYVEIWNKKNLWIFCITQVLQWC